ncbi:50S ribosomal protein L18 [Candidatus Parcubacteria bacterium]|jgi:large subunit ribosomal protein L18|nr:MAG: 50S ribosomal protein L18 [Candidatus Parcubacteria bacterium]
MNVAKRMQIQKERRAHRVRAKVRGEANRPRLSVFRSNSYIYAQLIDDVSGTTLVSANSRELKNGKSMEAATLVGKTIATRAKEKGITGAVFDRGGYRYHGRVKAIAEAVREGGIEM